MLGSVVVRRGEGAVRAELELGLGNAYIRRRPLEVWFHNRSRDRKCPLSARYTQSLGDESWKPEDRLRLPAVFPEVMLPSVAV